MRFQHLSIWLLTTSVLLVAEAHPKSGQTARHFVAPRFVSWTLAEARLNSDSVDGIKTLYDPKSGYYRFSSSDCFGTPRDIMLCSDPKMKDAHCRTPKRLKSIEHGALPLTNGHGIAIGDREGQVRAKLGQPTKIVRVKGKSKQCSYIYSCDFWKPKGKWHYHAIYTFQQDQLRAIRFLRGWEKNLIVKK